MRLRLTFEKGLVDSNLSRSWTLVPPSAKTISDLSYSILESFGLLEKCTTGLSLLLEDFVLPPTQSLNLIQPTDVITVRQKDLTTATKKRKRAETEEKEPTSKTTTKRRKTEHREEKGKRKDKDKKEAKKAEEKKDSEKKDKKKSKPKLVAKEKTEKPKPKEPMKEKEKPKSLEAVAPTKQLQITKEKPAQAARQVSRAAANTQPQTQPAKQNAPKQVVTPTTTQPTATSKPITQPAQPAARPVGIHTAGSANHVVFDEEGEPSENDVTLVRSAVYLRTPSRMTQESWLSTGWRKDRPEFQQKKKRRRRKSRTDTQPGVTQMMSIEQFVDRGDESIDFESLPPLTRPLKEGDIFAYKIFEVGPDWQPGLSDWKKAKTIEVNDNDITLEILNRPPPVEEEEAVEQDLNAFFRTIATEEGAENLEIVQYSDMQNVKLISAA